MTDNPLPSRRKFLTNVSRTIAGTTAAGIGIGFLLRSSRNGHAFDLDKEAQSGTFASTESPNFKAEDSATPFINMLSYIEMKDADFVRNMAGTKVSGADPHPMGIAKALAYSMSKTGEEAERVTLAIAEGAPNTANIAFLADGERKNAAQLAHDGYSKGDIHIEPNPKLAEKLAAILRDKEPSRVR